MTRVSGGRVNSESRWVHDLVGRVVEVDSCRWAGGWVIDVDGLAIYVQEERSLTGLGADQGPLSTEC